MESKFSYILTDNETGIERSFKGFLAAREEGQALVGQFDGWRQEQPNTWFLLPERRYTITVYANT